MMYSHYLKHGLKNFWRQKTTAIINMLGLTTGIASFILILLFLQNELGYEHHIPGSENIYRLVGIQRPAGIEEQHVAITSGPWAPTLKEELPEVEDALRLSNAGGLYRVDDKVFRQQYAYYAESSVVRFFNIQLAAGQPQGVLDEPNTAVISQRVAERFYGTTQVLGETFRLNGEPFRITGVMENYDHNSHLKLEVLISFPTFENAVPELVNWGSNYLSTYLMLRPGTNKEQTEANIFNYTDNRMNELGYHDAPRPEMYLQPMQDIHLKSKGIKFSIYDTRGDIVLIYVFSLVAFLILAIACINYINLATARATKRALEVGMRKTLGASPRSVFYQFMGESLITTFFALIMAVGLVELFLPSFNTILGTNLEVDFVGNPIFNIGLLVLLLVVGLMAGAYPALFMSRFRPIHALKNQVLSSRSSAGKLRKVLVTMQFAISVMLIFSTLIFYNQWTFMRNHELGINYDHVVSLSLLQQEPDVQALNQLKARFLSHPGIEGVALASGSNGVGGSQGPVAVADSSDTELMVRHGYVDEDFFPMMEVEIVEGRNFSKAHGTDAAQAVIINEAGARALGWDQAVGKQFIDNRDPEKVVTVIGVIKDYNFYSLHGKIEPALYWLAPDRNRSMVVRIHPQQQQQAFDHMQTLWQEYFNDVPFEPVFITENIEQQYAAEANAMRVITFFAVLCIIISALGLYGLTAFMAEQKKKEIAIRKVLGESVLSIVAGMQKIFLRLVVIAMIVGLPLVYLYMERWLDNFAYRISFAWWHFVLAAAVVVVIAFFTVLSHSWKAAVANPANAIKYE
ncbi:MAG: ABC transporter permease [Bacteroidales bacterium]